MWETEGSAAGKEFYATIYGAHKTRQIQDACGRTYPDNWPDDKVYQ